MRRERRSTPLLLILLCLATFALAGTPGSFRGTVVETDESRQDAGWIYVRGRDGSIRRVDITHANVTQGEDASGGKAMPQSKDLVPGTEVRVTAEQGSDGEWRAKSVEVLKKSEEAKPSAKAGKS